MKTVLITGGAGFLGRQIAREFLATGARVICIDAVLPENAPAGVSLTYHQLQLPNPVLMEVLRKEAPEICIHCAGRASVPFSMSDPAADFRDNTTLTFEVLEALRRAAPACGFLLLSSAAVYGNPPMLPVREDERCAPLSPYGFHKWMCELLCQEFAKVHGMRTAVVRIFSAYGAGLRRQVIWDICAKALGSGGVALRGTGEESRDFIHAVDIARALVLLAEKAEWDGAIYNLASGAETTIAALAARLVELLECPTVPQFDGKRFAGEPVRWQADVAKIRALGFAPSMTLDRGLATVATWARAELRGDLPTLRH
jgi:UDP-glucose 4-epimerase